MPPAGSSRCTTRLSATLGELLDDAVELGRAEPDAAAVEGGVAAPGHHAAAVGLEDDPVAVPPDARVAVEVGRPQQRLPSVVAPEADRHRRHRRGDDQLAGLADDLAAVLVEGVRVDGQRAAGDHPGAHRQQRVVLHQAAADVGAAAADVELDVAARAARRSRRSPRAAAARRPSRPRAAARSRSPQVDARRRGRPSRTRDWRPSSSPRSPRRAATASRGRGRPGRRRSSRSTRRRAARRPGRSTSSRRWSSTRAACRRDRGPTTARGSSGARARCRRGRARSPSAGPSCRRRTARPAGGRTGTGAISRHRVGDGAEQVRPGRGVARPATRRTRMSSDVPHARQRRRGSSATCSRRSIVLAAVAVAAGDEQHDRLDLAEAVDDAARRRTRWRSWSTPRRGRPRPGRRPAPRGSSGR